MIGISAMWFPLLPPTPPCSLSLVLLGDYKPAGTSSPTPRSASSSLSPDKSHKGGPADNTSDPESEAVSNDWGGKAVSIAREES